MLDYILPLTSALAIIFLLYIVANMSRSVPYFSPKVTDLLIALFMAVAVEQLLRVIAHVLEPTKLPWLLDTIVPLVVGVAVFVYWRHSVSRESSFNGLNVRDHIRVVSSRPRAIITEDNKAFPWNPDMEALVHKEGIIVDKRKLSDVTIAYKINLDNGLNCWHRRWLSSAVPRKDADL